VFSGDKGAFCGNKVVVKNYNFYFLQIKNYILVERGYDTAIWIRLNKQKHYKSFERVQYHILF
jgi:hypothetical protein